MGTPLVSSPHFSFSNARFPNQSAMEENESPISEFYTGQCVFITGSTGFMGKVLVEKLLRSCSGIKTIYLLLRSKRGRNSKQRLEELLSAKVFDRIKSENASVFEKLVPISGDITLPKLGLSPEDTELLAQNVSIVFHSAATVKFDEPLKRSVEMNVVGTRRMVELCHKMVKLVSFVHVSTAYCNCDREEILEKVYPPPVQPQQIIDAMEWMNEELVTSITPRLIGNRPNTYTYTKALAENLLVDECGGLPVAIVRPSIVTAAWREPIPGWVDNLNGPTGLVAAAMKGLLHSVLANVDAVSDFIPVDLCINLMITVAWYTATQRPNNVAVYHCTSSPLNKITWKDVEVTSFPLILRHPSSELFSYPSGTFKNYRLVHQFCLFFYHYFPAYVADCLCYLTGKKARVVSIYTKLHRAMECLEYFTTHQWHFHPTNTLMLLEQLKGTDARTFSFDIRRVVWQVYWEDYVVGIRTYVLKEDLNTLPTARRNLRKTFLIGQLVNLLMVIGVWRVLMQRYASVRRAWYLVISLALRLYNILPVMMRF